MRKFKSGTEELELTMSTLKNNDVALKELLTSAKVIAVVGHSDNPSRTSYQIAQFLRQVGYTVYAVNPAVTKIDGQPSYPALADVPEAIDIVNVFRRSQFLPEVVDEAIAVQAKSIWAQLGVFHPAAEQKASAAKIPLIMDACIKVEYWRLGMQQP
jgi:predicted CoA-binding protein